MAEIANLQEIIRENIERIKSVLRDCSTESVVGYAMVKHRRGFPQPGLSSPAKQIRLMLGVMLGTEEPSNPVEFSHRHWEQCLDPLQTLVQAYMSLYMPTDGTMAEQSEEWHRSSQVAMTAFLDYHQKGLLASGEQISDRIQSYLGPLDDELTSVLGLSASDALSIALDIGNDYQAQLDRVARSNPSLATTTDSVVDFVEAINQLGKTRHSDLFERYRSVGQRFWELFTVARGEGPINQLSHQTHCS